MDRTAIIGNFQMKRNCFKACGLFSVMTLCIGFLSCTSVSFSASKPCTVPEDFFGISPDRSPLNKEDYALLDDFNAVWIRTTLSWSDVEPEKGKWNFDRWDTYLEKAEAAGKKVVFILGFDNGWLFSDNKEHRKITDKELPYYLKYVEQVVSRYRTRAIYEIWNEPNVIFWKGSNKQFFTLSAAAAKKIRETEPEAVILAGSTFRVSKRFTRGMFNSGAMEYADAFSVHPYAFTPKATIRQYNKLKSLLGEFEFDKPVWITEVGYFTGPRPFFGTKRYAGYIVKTLSSLSARAGEIRSIIWYELMNDNNPGEEKEPLNPLTYMGLIYPNKIFKPGTEAFMLTAGYIAGTEYHPEFPLREGIARNVTSLYFLKKDGTSVLILWKDGLGKQNLYLTVPNAMNLSRHNIYNREVTLLPDKAALEISREPVFITWNGGDPPLLYEPEK